jgi:hypothetical protein
MKPRFAIMLAALWWGSLTALGFLVVPMLFANLGSPAAAGAMAAKLFTAQTWLSIACTMLLLAISSQNSSQTHTFIPPSAIKLVVAGLLLTVLVEFGVSPRIVTARASGGDLRVWHGLGSAMYFGQWVCAGLALWHFSGVPTQAHRPIES